MVKFRFENPIITNTNRVRYGLHPRDPVKTPSGALTTVPVIAKLKPLGNARVEIRVHDETTPDSRAIPYGYNGCLLRYAWGPEPLTDRAALTQSILMTHLPYTLTLPPEASGSRAFPVQPAGRAATFWAAQCNSQRGDRIRFAVPDAQRWGGDTGGALCTCSAE
jgi:hypothetical protein